MFDKSYFLECINCKKVLDEKKYYFLCNKCSNPVDIIYDYNIIREQLNLHVLKDSTIKSVKYLANSDKMVFFCGWKFTKRPPFCDNSHIKL